MAARPSILQRASLRGLAQQRWQTALMLCGIAMGVAIVVAVDLANSSAQRAFALTLSSISGTATHQIVGGPIGIDERMFTRLRLEAGLRRSAPLVMGRVSAADGRRYTLMGIDLLSERDLGRHFEALNRSVASSGEGLWEPQAVAMQASTAQALGLQTGDELVLASGAGAATVTLGLVFRGSDESLGGLIFADIALAQELLGRQGVVDRIDLALEAAEIDRVTSWLPPGLVLLESDFRNASLQAMSEAFHLNLSAMSLLALLVAGLLIYNTVSFSVLRRRHTLGVLRSLGLTRRELLRMIAQEAALVGILGCVVGLLLGLLLGQGLVQLVTRTINDLYFHLHVTRFVPDGFSLMKGLLLGLSVTAIAAALPAREAAFSAPVSVQQRSTLERRDRRRLPLIAAVGLGLMGIGQMLLSGTGGSLVQGFAGLMLQILGYCLLVPGLLLLSSLLLLKLLSRARLLGPRLALRGISGGISRTGLAVAALTVAVSVTVGVGVMVGSFRDSVAQWLDQSLSGDVYVASRVAHQLPLSPQLQHALRQLPATDRVTRSRRVRIETEFGPISLLARDFSPTADAEYRLLQGDDSAWTALRTGHGVFISEPLAWRQRLSPGDSIQLQTAHGPDRFPVLGVFTDYSSSRGMVLISLDAYRSAWDDHAVSGLALKVGENVDPAALLATVRSVLDEQAEGFDAVSNRSIREHSLQVFDRTFAITRVLRLLAILVAFIGVLSALMALQLERGRDYAVLRSTGMTPSQLARLILLQTALLGLMAGLFALPLGWLMSEVLIDVINRRSFGWTMDHSLPPAVLFEAILLALTAALLAGLYPAWRAARSAPARALREE